MKSKSWVLWTLSAIMVVSAAYYQMRTGPTYPVRGATLIGQQDVTYRLLTTSDAEGDQEIRVSVPDPAIKGVIKLRRTPSRDEWREEAMERQGEFLVGRLPHQPPAGKVMYQIFLGSGDSLVSLTSQPVVLRFRMPIPIYILIPHVVLMFLAMLYSTRCGIEAFVRGPSVYKLAIWTLVFLGVGGFILGTIQQKLAFGAFWTGWPVGRDLTDNKTFVAALFWILAFWRLRKHPDSRGWPVAAAIVLMLVYMIPHSLMGSEIDFTQPPEGNPGL